MLFKCLNNMVGKWVPAMAEKV